MQITSNMQPFEFIEHIKQYLEYSDKKEISELSGLNISKVYNLLIHGTGKKNSLIIAKTALTLLEKRQITDDVIVEFKKKFVTTTNN